MIVRTWPGVWSEDRAHFSMMRTNALRPDRAGLIRLLVSPANSIKAGPAERESGQGNGGGLARVLHLPTAG